MMSGEMNNKPAAPAPDADAIMALLREAQLQIEYLHGRFGKTGSGTAVLARIDAALKEKA